jgi:uncharacterized Zn finger protein (UPF0148 family)
MAELYCRKCGQPLRDTDNFCPKCGTRVEREEKAETAPAAGKQPADHSRNEQAAQNMQKTEPAVQGLREHEADDRRNAGEVSGEEEIRKNREAFHIDDFDWGNSDYPSGHPHKTEEVNFNWHTTSAAPESNEEKTRVFDREALKAEQEKSDAAGEADHDAAETAEEPQIPSQDDTDAVSERVERDLDAIDTFYTYSQKNEEFQKVLNKEYDRIRKEAPAVPAAAAPEERAAERRGKEEPEASPEETLHKLEELAKKAQSVTEASSRAAEAASEMYGEDDPNASEEEDEGSRPEEDLRHKAARVQDLLDRQEQNEQQSQMEKPDQKAQESAQESAENPEKDGGQDEPSEPEHAGGAAEPASSGTAMNYVFNPEEEAAKKKQKKKKRHIGLKIFITIIILLIIVEAGFLILRKVAPDSAVCVQLEKVFMHIADLVYNHFG